MTLEWSQPLTAVSWNHSLPKLQHANLSVKLKITPLRIANVPPPMALLQLDLDCIPVDVAFSHSGNRIAIISENDVAVYGFDLKKRPVVSPTLIWRGMIQEDLGGHSPRHVVFSNNEKLYVLSDIWDEDESFMLMCEDYEDNKGGSVTQLCPILEPGNTSSLASDVEGKHIFLNFRNGSVNLVREDGIQTNFPAIALLPSFASEVKVAILEEQVCTC